MGLQNDNILDAWSYCSNLANEVAVDTAPHSDVVGLGHVLLQGLLYTLAFPAGFGFGRLVMRGQSRRAAIIVACLFGVLLCAALFVGDFALNNGEAPGFYLPERCPAGRPPWWPSWLPLHVG
jgi:hypothetical protein